MNAKDIFERFKGKKILVIGDVMIDEYLLGRVDRISPEAPVPIISLSKKEMRLGGAANVALNLSSLGADPILCAVIGNDISGDHFIDLLEKRGMVADGIVRSENRTTTVKTRVIGDNQHLLRIDEEVVEDLNDRQEKEIVEKVRTLVAKGVDAVILEDYNKGLLTPAVIKGVIQICKQNNIIVTVDPKRDNFMEFRGVTLFKPNLKELKEGVNIHFDFSTDRDAFESAIRAMETQLENEISFVTLSEHGVFIKSKEEVNYLPAHIRNIADVSGAGDTVISVATLCLVAGLPPRDVAAIANLAGGLVCEMSGVVPINKEQLLAEVEKLEQ